MLSEREENQFLGRSIVVLLQIVKVAFDLGFDIADCQPLRLGELRLRRIEVTPEVPPEPVTTVLKDAVMSLVQSFDQSLGSELCLRVVGALLEGDSS